MKPFLLSDSTDIKSYCQIAIKASKHLASVSVPIGLQVGNQPSAEPSREAGIGELTLPSLVFLLTQSP